MHAIVAPAAAAEVRMDTSIMDLLGSVSVGFLAGVFAFAGLTKAIGMRDFRWTLERLGIDEAHTAQVGLGVVGAELVAAVGLLISPAQTWPRMLVAALAVTFAFAGLTALKAKERIDCNCFGNLRRGFLGWRQVVLLPCLLLFAAMGQWHSPTWSARQGVLGLTSLVLAVACWQVFQAVPAWRALRADRLALNQDRGLVMVDLTAREGRDPA
jgi:hypothetical protein